VSVCLCVRERDLEREREREREREFRERDYSITEIDNRAMMDQCLYHICVTFA
jgi:hypothetical protein